jgi:hypothetical protein
LWVANFNKLVTFENEKFKEVPGSQNIMVLLQLLRMKMELFGLELMVMEY